MEQHEKCAYKMHDRYYPTRCTRRGVVSEDGKKWCKQHAPSSVKARAKKADAARYARWDSISAIDNARATILECEACLIEWCRKSCDQAVISELERLDKARAQLAELEAQNAE